MKTRTITTACDLCGYGSHYSRPEDFTPRGAYDLCKWCMTKPFRETTCGTHTVTVVGDSWTCSCGTTMVALKTTLLGHGVSHGAMAAAPNLTAATAAIHVQTPNWPQTY